MRLSLHGPLAAAASIAVLACGCGGGDDDEKRRISTVLEQTRDAVLAGDGRAACARMTPNARRKVLQLPGEGYTDTVSDPRPPRGCAQVIARVSADGREHRAGTRGYAVVDEEAWHRDAPRATFEVTDVSGDRAEARVEVEGAEPNIRIRLRRSGGEWLIDDADGIVDLGE